MACGWCIPPAPAPPLPLMRRHCLRLDSHRQAGGAVGSGAQTARHRSHRLGDGVGADRGMLGASAGRAAACRGGVAVKVVVQKGKAGRNKHRGQQACVCVVQKRAAGA